jgi:hypothetical protein
MFSQWLNKNKWQLITLTAIILFGILKQGTVRANFNIKFTVNEKTLE